MRRYYYLITLLPALALWGCGGTSDSNSNINSVDEEFHGLRLENMDTTVSPREDFFRYANGGYLANTEIPPEESSWGVFQELRENTAKRVRTILESASDNNPGKGSVAQQIGDYYKSGMDSTAINERGAEALKPYLEKIDGVSSWDDVLRTLGWFHKRRIGGGFGLWADSDAKNSKMTIINLFQGGMGLPDRDYYLDDSPRRQEIRDKYVEYATTIFTLIGEEEETAAANAAKILEMETQLAGAALARVEMRNPDKTYHKMDIDGLSAIAPGDWKAYFSEIGAADPGEFNVGMPDFMAELSKMGSSYPIDDWKTYLRWSLARSTTGLLSDDFIEADFEFNSKTLTGAEEMQPRWKRVTSGAGWALGMAIGQLYVKEHFSPRAKEIALEMVENILTVMKDRLAGLEWMGEETRQKAIAKVNTIRPKIGYPDKWRSYEGLEIGDNYFDNVMAARAFNFDYMMSKVGKEIDPEEWRLPPQVVNAFYNPTRNEIVFPAAILQAPFFDEHVDAALNYGGFGAVIGHELTHAFDDQGSKFDSEGNLANWWTDEDRAAFESFADGVVAQYAAYKVLDSLPINGRLTLGENIADIDGLRISFAAWQHSLIGKEKPVSADGFTPEQRFFVNYGQIWASKMRDESLRLMIATNPHSPAEYRVMGSLSNLPEFYAAFDVKEGDRMWRPDSLRMQIW